MAATIMVSATKDRGKTYTVQLAKDVKHFEDATVSLHEWLWGNVPQEDCARVIMAWMRGEIYADHSVCVRHYVRGTVGHWFEIMYRA